LKLTKEVKTGLVVVVGLAMFIYGFNFLKGSNLFSTEKTIYAIYENVDGLLESNNIQLSGMKVGLVKKISLMPGDSKGRILVTMSVQDIVNIPTDSKARIVSSDLLGTKSIRLELGTFSALIKSGDTLAAEREEGLRASVDKRIAPLQAKAEGLIASIDSVMIVVQEVLNKDARENLSKSFESVKRAISTFEKTAVRLDGLIETQQYKLTSIFTKVESITNNLANNNDKITKILTNFESISDSLAKSNFEAAIQNANQAMTDVSNIVAKINKGQGTMGMLINNDSLYLKLDKSATDLDLLLQDLKANPKRYVHFSIFDSDEKKSRKK